MQPAQNGPLGRDRSAHCRAHRDTHPVAELGYFTQDGFFIDTDGPGRGQATLP